MLVDHFLLTDQVGTLRAVADSKGMIVKRVDYDSFGNIIADSNPSFSVPFGFAGGLHDRDTGLVRFGYRDYSPEVGRFVAKDPIDFAGGDTNLYAYVTSDPVNFTDPLGLYCGSGCTDAIVPDFPGGFDFQEACKAHDKCYGTPGAKKWACDLTLPATAIKGECSKYSGLKKLRCIVRPRPTPSCR